MGPRATSLLALPASDKEAIDGLVTHFEGELAGCTDLVKCQGGVCRVVKRTCGQVPPNSVAGG
jgi:hypothetical protein